MKIVAGLFFVIIGSLSTTTGVAQSNDKASLLNKSLAAELYQMGEDDQKYRGVIEAELIKMSSAGTAKASNEFVAAVKSG